MDPSLRQGYRTLNACAACARQYDVSHLSEGAKVRCECGQVLRAHFERPRQPRHLRCSNCGGNVSAAERACTYCGAEVTLEEKGLSSICPRCYARLTDRARFCMECGIPIQPQALFALAEGSACPRCRAGLQRRQLTDAEAIECRSCGGLWLTQDRFEALCETAESQDQTARELRLRPQPERPGEAQPPRYLPCVACGELMNRRNYSGSSGVVIDVCKRHGVWLDHAEMEKVLAFVRGGGLDRSRQREIERLRDERLRKSDAAPAASLPDGRLGRADSYGAGDLLSEWVLDVCARLWK